MLNAIPRIRRQPPALAPGVPWFTDARVWGDACDLTDRRLDGPDLCCASCERVAGSRVWIDALDALCSSRRPAGCPDLDCPADARAPVCVSHRCVSW